ncbi:Retrovirus-related Pol polyprotein from transposon 17.6, partial [Mucuna pruriens]
MPFRLKNAGATYQRAMVTLFHDMMHKEVEVYVDDMIAKAKTPDQHVEDLYKLFERLRKYQLKLNPAKCTFGVKTRKLLGFTVNERGIELDPNKVEAIRNMPSPKTKTEVRGFLGRVNYIARFISQLTATCSPIFKLLRKNQKMEWNQKCQEAFEKVKQYLAEPLILVPIIPDKPLVHGGYVGATRCLRKGASNLLQKIHRMQIEVPNTKAYLLRFNLGSEKAKAVHASPHQPTPHGSSLN